MRRLRTGFYVLAAAFGLLLIWRMNDKADGSSITPPAISHESAGAASVGTGTVSVADAPRLVNTGMTERSRRAIRTIRTAVTSPRHAPGVPSVFNGNLESRDWAVGETLRIDWPHNAFTGPVAVQYRTDNGDWDNIVTSLSDAGHVDWTPPRTLAGKNVIIRTRDSHRSLTTSPIAILPRREDGMRISRPAPGEAVRTGVTTPVTLDAVGSLTNRDVIVDFSPDAGMTWIDDTGRGSTIGGAVAWNVPDTETDTAKLRIRDAQTHDVLAETDSVFAVLADAPPVLDSDDLFEDNDSYSAPFVFNDFSSGRIEQDGLKLFDADYYQVTAESDGMITVTIRFDHNDTDMFMKLWKNGTEIAESDYSDGDSGQEEISATVQTNDIIIVGIGAVSGLLGTDYDLLFRTDDAFEDHAGAGSGNDTLAEPFYLGQFSGAFGEKITDAPINGEPLNDLILADNADVYSFDLPPVHAGYKLLCELRESAGGDNFKLELFRGDDQPLGMSDSTGTDRERVVLNTSVSTTVVTTYKLRVTQSAAGVFSTYSLAFYSDDIMDDDTLNGDDTLASAPTVTLPYAITDARSIDDMDVIKVFLDEGPVVAILKHDESQGNLNLQLSNTTDGTALQSSNTTNDVETIDFTVSTSGLYYVQVCGAFGESNPDYSLSVCQEDAYDTGGASNDTITEADANTDLGIVGFGGGSDKNLTGLFSNDADLFKITCGSSTQTLFAEIHYAYRAGALTLSLYDAVGKRLGSSSRASDDSEYERLIWTAAADTTYYIGIARNTSNHNIYNLTVAADDADDDPALAEQNDLVINATNLYSTYNLGNPSGPALQELTLSNRVGIDDDWYRIHVARAGRIGFKLTFNTNDGNLNSNLRRMDGTLLASSQGTTSLNDEFDDVEELILWVDSGPDYAFGVIQGDKYPTGARNTRYTLKVTLDDFQEPNNAFSQAWKLDPGMHSNMRSFDPDYFYVVTPKSGRMIVRIDNYTYDAAENALKLELLDSQATSLGASASAADDQTVSITVSAGDVIVIAVTDEGGSGTKYSHFDDRYDLLVQFDDAYEDNDTQGTAALIDIGQEYDDLWKLDSLDFYTLDVPKNREFSAEIAFEHAAGDLSLSIFDSDGALLGTSDTTQDTEKVTIPAYGSNRSVIIRVAGEINEKPYTLIANVEDGYEINDSAAEAVPIGVNKLYGNLYLAASDQDWYSFTATETKQTYVMLRSDVDMGNLNLELFANDGVTSLSTSDSATGLDTIVFNATAGTSYKLAVRGEANPDYELSIWTDDGDEDNDTAATAATISDGTKRLLDDDWYATGVQLSTYNNRITLTYARDDGQVNLAVYESDGVTLIGESRNGAGSESVEWTGEAGKSYRIYITPDSGDFSPAYILDFTANNSSSSGLYKGNCSLSRARIGTSESDGILTAFFVMIAMLLTGIIRRRATRHA